MNSGAELVRVESELRKRHETFWADCECLSPHQIAKAYIDADGDSLLAADLAHARRREELNPGRVLSQHHYRTMVFLLGFSLEPLVQSVCVYRPERVVLLYSPAYNHPGDGEAYAGAAAALITADLAQSPELGYSPTVDCHPLAGTTPEDVFASLIEHVLPLLARDARDPLPAAGAATADQDPHPVIIDTTGGKKSMDVGAFLFAAYSNIPVSYVDFDHFSSAKRRPYGFSCRILPLENPYRLFALREWPRLRQLYERYHFRAALETLAEIERSPLSATLSTAHANALPLLREALVFYSLWDEGDYPAARAKRDSWAKSFPGLVDLDPPTAVTTLGTTEWPSARRQRDEDLAASATRLAEEHEVLLLNLVLANEMLFAYAYDELDKIKRAIDNSADYRSALLRAVGIDEFLLRARWLRLVRVGGVRVWNGNPGGHGAQDVTAELRDNATARRAIAAAVRLYDNARDMRFALAQAPEKGRIPYLVVKPRMEGDRLPTYWLTRTNHGPFTGPYDRIPGNPPSSVLADLRNKSIHTYLYIPQSLALAAYQLAEANLTELDTEAWRALARDPAPTPEPADRPYTEAVPWRRLVELCHLDFLPPIPDPGEA